MLHYYLNLCDGNIDRAVAIKCIAENQFQQFEQYLQNSIIALKNKEEISANWEKVEIPNLAKLQILGSLYQYNKQTVICITHNQKGYYHIELLKGNPNFSKNIEYQIGDTEGEFTITEDDYEKGLVYIEGLEINTFDAIRWGFADIDLTPTWFTLKINEVLRDSKGTEHKIIMVNNDNITVEGVLQPDEELYYGETKIRFTISKKAKLPFQNVVIKQENDTHIIFYSRNELNEIPTGIDRIDKWQVKYFIDFTNIVFEKDPRERLQFDREEDGDELSIILHNKSDYGKIVVSNDIYLRITEPPKSDVDSWKIRLKEIHDEDDDIDEQNALSPLRYFFDENVSIIENINIDSYKYKRNKYFAEQRGSNKDENQIVLRWDGIKEENGRKSINPLSFPEGPILKVQVDTKPLERQLAAVNILREMPHKKHEMLIRLFEKRVEEDKQWLQWPRPENNAYIKDNEWFVLKDEKRSGCPEQRNFIKKALNTPDFAILEGPPGSGKTTAILELICQLVSQKKRVLLCGSTNVAIDNILERLIEKDQNKSSLLERIDILPVRIGRPERVEQTIADYQIDNLIGENSTEDERNLKQRLLLDAANLVCGTTMGIVNHPKFKEQIGTNFNGNSPVIPEFDCLIIDESSKTTFQEFLVPALYAKRWILAGDVMQLSPFTERESIEFNFEKLSLKNNSEKYEVLDINIQRAVFFLNTIKSCLYWINGKIQGKNQNSKGNNHFVLPCLSDLLVKIVQELRSGRIDLFIHEELFIFVTKDEIIMTDKESIQPSQHEQILLRTLKTVNYLELTAADVIFVDSSIIEQIIEKLPETHAILQLKDWETMPHAFYHNVFQQKGKFGYFHRQFGSQNSFEIVNKLNEDIKERSWAQEIAWRIDSEHQLRLVDKSRRKEKLGGEIDELTPCSVDKGNFEEARNMISAISFPSILESLRFGIKGKKPIVPSTISEGFYPDTLEDRKITLTFQHRMHPDISIFPRRQYYKDTNALLDLEAPKPIRESRKWDYDYYKKRGIEKRSIWVNVRSPTTGSRNIYEVEAMTQHLKYFLEYAVIHPQPEGKTWEVACLAFYKGQEKLIREGGYNNKTQYNVNGLQTITENYRSNSNFNYNRDKTKGPYPVFIRLHTVDRFQGHEADVVLLSMSQTKKDGFLDNPNRLNVSITRAKFQLLIFGKYEYFSKYSHSDDLKALALAHENSII